jgi:hypothetical protein
MLPIIYARYLPALYNSKGRRKRKGATFGPPLPNMLVQETAYEESP